MMESNIEVVERKLREKLPNTYICIEHSEAAAVFDVWVGNKKHELCADFLSQVGPLRASNSILTCHEKLDGLQPALTRSDWVIARFHASYDTARTLLGQRFVDVFWKKARQVREKFRAGVWSLDAYDAALLHELVDGTITLLSTRDKAAKEKAMTDEMESGVEEAEFQGHKFYTKFPPDKELGEVTEKLAKKYGERPHVNLAATYEKEPEIPDWWIFPYPPPDEVK